MNKLRLLLPPCQSDAIIIENISSDVEGLIGIEIRNFDERILCLFLLGQIEIKLLVWLGPGDILINLIHKVDGKSYKSSEIIKVDKVPQEYYLNMNYYIIGIALLIAIIYYAKFRRYHVFYQSPYDPKRKNIGQTLPPFINGWFIVTKSENLKNGQILNLERWGQNIAVYRGTNGKVYALDAYCAHMGANLAVEGQVKNDSCIQCPFHGWSYDGQSGHCVDSSKKPLRGISFEYNDDVGVKDTPLVWKQCQGEIKLRKYPIQEKNGYIHIWIHAVKQFQNSPQYELLDLQWVADQLEYRGSAYNVIRCHVQDIPENGADIMHFYYVHKYVSKLIKFISITWKANWKVGSDPTIHEIFSHRLPYIHEFKQKIFNKHIRNNKDAQYIGCVTVDGYPSVPVIGEFFGYNITVLQFGSGIVYIFVKSLLFTACFVQYTQTDGKYTQNVYHDLYMSKMLPYWFSAWLINIQSVQVLNDGYIWDAKQFKKKVYYRKDSPADQSMKVWREWYYQFYEGCADKDRKDMDW